MMQYLTSWATDFVLNLGEAGNIQCVQMARLFAQKDFAFYQNENLPKTFQIYQRRFKMFIKYQLYPKNYPKTFEIMPNLVTLITLFWTKHLSAAFKYFCLLKRNSATTFIYLRLKENSQWTYLGFNFNALKDYFQNCEILKMFWLKVEQSKLNGKWLWLSW